MPGEVLAKFFEVPLPCEALQEFLGRHRNSLIAMMRELGVKRQAIDERPVGQSGGIVGPRLHCDVQLFFCTSTRLKALLKDCQSFAATAYVSVLGRDKSVNSASAVSPARFKFDGTGRFRIYFTARTGLRNNARANSRSCQPSALNVRCLSLPCRSVLASVNATRSVDARPIDIADNASAPRLPMASLPERRDAACGETGLPGQPVRGLRCVGNKRAEMLPQVHGKFRDIKLIARHDKANPLADQARAVVRGHRRGRENDNRVGGRTNQRYVFGDFGRCCRIFTRSRITSVSDNTRLEKAIGALDKCGQALRSLERPDVDTIMQRLAEIALRSATNISSIRRPFLTTECTLTLLLLSCKIGVSILLNFRFWCGLTPPGVVTASSGGPSK